MISEQFLRIRRLITHTSDVSFVLIAAVPDHSDSRILEPESERRNQDQDEGVLMELSFLYSIPRTGFLDAFFLFFTRLPGAYGQLWLAIGIVLLIFKKTRRTGIAVLISFAGVLLFGELLLKHVVSRMRPCQIDQAFALLVERPASSSFPSTHSAFAFGAATAIFMNYKKAGVAVLIAAALIAFSRLYLFLHFPTDVLCGIALGIVMGIAAVKLSDLLARKVQKEQ